MTIRVATKNDVEQMVALAARFREALAGYSPVYWRKADDAKQKQAVFFEILLGLDDVIALVDDDAGLRAFAIGRITPAPPVYAPGGPVCLIDDFAADDSEWATRGDALLGAIEAHARERGAVLSVVICPHLAAGKRGLLAKRGFEPTCEWHVKEL